MAASTPAYTSMTLEIVPGAPRSYRFRIPGGVFRVELEDYMINGVDAGDVGDCFLLRLNSSWRSENFYFLTSKTLGGFEAAQAPSMTQDLPLFIDASPTTHWNPSNPFIINRGVKIDNPEQNIMPEILMADKSVPTYTSAWIRLRFWQLPDPINNSPGLNYIQSVFRN